MITVMSSRHLEPLVMILVSFQIVESVMEIKTGKTRVDHILEQFRHHHSSEENPHGYSPGIKQICVLCKDMFGIGRGYTLANGTPAEIGPICLTCRNTILADKDAS